MCRLAPTRVLGAPPPGGAEAIGRQARARRRNPWAANAGAQLQVTPPSAAPETLHSRSDYRSRCVRTQFVVLLCVAASMSTVALNWCCIACILRCKSAAVSVHIRGDTRVGWRALYTVCRLYKGDTVQPRQRVRSGRSVLVHLTASHTAETPWRRRLPVVAFEGPSAHTTRTWAPHRAGA